MKLKSISLQRPTKAGFTLVELLVVIIILGILAALIVPKVIGKSAQAKVAAANSDINSLADMLNNFHLDCDRFPTTEEGLNALNTMPSGLDGKWKGPYNQKPIPNDPWGNPYVYKSPGANGSDSFSLESYGPTGQEGGTGDNAPIIYNSN